MKALGLLLVCALPAAAEVQLQSVGWQRLVRGQAPAVQPEDIVRIGLTPGKKVEGRLLARVRMLNRGSAVAGIVLRYVVSAKIARPGKSEEAAWALPFMSEEKRVPKVGANEHFETVLDPTILTGIYLRKLDREGYWPLQLKIKVMLGPRRDVQGPLQIIESDLPVTAG